MRRPRRTLKNWLLLSSAGAAAKVLGASKEHGAGKAPKRKPEQNPAPLTMQNAHSGAGARLTLFLSKGHPVRRHACGAHVHADLHRCRFTACYRVLGSL